MSPKKPTRKKPSRTPPDGHALHPEAILLTPADVHRLAMVRRPMEQAFDRFEMAREQLAQAQAEANRTLLDVLQAHGRNGKDAERNWVTKPVKDEVVLYPLSEDDDAGTA